MLDVFMKWVSSDATWLILGYIVVLYAAFRKSLVVLTIVLLIIAAVGFSDLTCTFFLKPYLASIDSCHFIKLLKLTVSSCGAEYGLPSTHAAKGMAAATIVFWMARGLLTNASVVAAALIGISRVYLGVHLAVDIFFAFLIGALIGTTVFWSWRVTAESITRFLTEV